MTTKANLLARKLTFSYYHRATTRQVREPHPLTPASRSQEDLERKPATPIKKRGGGEKPRPRRPPHNPSQQTTPPGGGQERTTTKIGEAPPHWTGQAARPGEGPPAPHKTPTHPSQGLPTDRRVQRNPSQDHAPHNQSKNRGVRMKPLPVKLS